MATVAKGNVMTTQCTASCSRLLPSKTWVAIDGPRGGMVAQTPWHSKQLWANVAGVWLDAKR